MPDPVGTAYHGHPHSFLRNQRLQNITTKIRRLCNGASSLLDIFVDCLQAGAGF